MDVKSRAGHRQRQAEATKRQVAEAARVAFAQRGYAATTIKAISEAAEIPVPTIYSAFGGKAGILQKITELWMAESRTADLARASLAEPEPAAQLRLLAELNRRQLEAGADILAIYQDAARAEDSMAEVLRSVLASREREIHRLLATLEGALRPGVSLDVALDITLALTVPEVYSCLVAERGWTGEEYETWLAEALAGQLLGATDHRGDARTKVKRAPPSSASRS